MEIIRINVHEHSIFPVHEHCIQPQSVREDTNQYLLMPTELLIGVVASGERVE